MHLYLDFGKPSAQFKFSSQFNRKMDDTLSLFHSFICVHSCVKEILLFFPVHSHFYTTKSMHTKGSYVVFLLSNFISYTNWKQYIAAHRARAENSCTINKWSNQLCKMTLDTQFAINFTWFRFFCSCNFFRRETNHIYFDRDKMWKIADFFSHAILFEHIYLLVLFGHASCSKKAIAPIFD